MVVLKYQKEENFRIRGSLKNLFTGMGLHLHHVISPRSRFAWQLGGRGVPFDTWVYILGTFQPQIHCVEPDAEEPSRQWYTGDPSRQLSEVFAAKFALSGAQWMPS